jgi:hypothetical protein
MSDQSKEKLPEVYLNRYTLKRQPAKAIIKCSGRWVKIKLLCSLFALNSVNRSMSYYETICFMVLHAFVRRKAIIFRLVGSPAGALWLNTSPIPSCILPGRC